MHKRLSDETRDAILSGLEALAHGATRIEIPVEAETIYLTKLGPGRSQITIANKEKRHSLRRNPGRSERSAKLTLDGRN